MATRAGIKTAVQAALAACTAAASIPVSALGLGEIRMQSFLNEPLRAEVELFDMRELAADDIRIRLAASEDFDRLGVERSYFLTGIQFEVRVDAATRRGVIRLSTEESVLEPYLDFIIEARWPSGRLLREYTVLVDPPVFRRDMVTVSATREIEATASKPAEPTQKSMQDSAQSSTGDSVRLRESDLSPGQMPERAFSAETASTPSVGKRYMVRRDETLWEIAAQARPGGITVQQAMLDIQRLNPEAFIDNNINLIKAGYIIYLPAAGEVDSDDLATALDEVRSQNAQWQARRVPGVTAAATLRISALSPEGAREARAPDEESSALAPGSQDAAADGDGGVAGATEASAEEESDPQDPPPPAGASTASAELLAQLDAMSERLNTVEQIVTVKDEQIAMLQQAVREAQREAREAVAAARTAASMPPPAVRPASGGIPWLPIVGGLVILLGLVALVLRRRARSLADDAALVGDRSTGDDVFTGVSLNKNALEGAEALAKPKAEDRAVAAPAEDGDDKGDAEAGDVDELLDPGGSRGYGERKHDDYIDDAAAGDALAEADIYIAYGRYLQAIELLSEAIKNEPGNGAYRIKLIELYVDMGEEQNAAEQLDELRAHGDAAAITRAEALVGGMGGGDADPSGAESVDSLSGVASDDVASDDEQLADASSAAGEGAAAMGEKADEASSLELDVPATPASEQAPQDEADVPTSVSLEPQDPLEFSLKDLEAAQPAESPGSAKSEAISETTGFEASDDTEIIEFDNLEIVGDRAEPAASDEHFDLSDGLTPAEDATAQGEEEVLIADDADQMATKLDLARAYLDMGDSESARGMLEEVAGNGSAEQQREAQELLSRIG